MSRIPGERSDHELAIPERWRMKNGSVAVITHRNGAYCCGHIDGTETCIHTWVNGENRAGKGYDLDEQMEASR